MANNEIENVDGIMFSEEDDTRDSFHNEIPTKQVLAHANKHNEQIMPICCETHQQSSSCMGRSGDSFCGGYAGHSNLFNDKTYRTIAYTLVIVECLYV